MTTTARQRVLEACQAVHDYQAATGRVHYTEDSRRMSIVRHKLKPPFHSTIYEDCSSFATAVYWLAGAHDPNGLRFDGQGYTGTLGRNGIIVAHQAARPADLVFYGGGFPWAHVAVYAGGGYVWSHGHQGGPYHVSTDYRRDRGEVRSYLPHA